MDSQIGMRDSKSSHSRLEINGAGVSTEMGKSEISKILPSAWLQSFENDVKDSTASSSNLQSVAFISENTNSTNEVSTAYGVSNTSSHNLKLEHTSSYSLLASQSSCPQLDREDLDQS
ncbi:hypothetical protein Tco_0926915 [Tanacetum coccineum]|uniref:Uncharacterized protein n=1 Tax=Tanacetum coccineum TaxID=301880 RepID=A0ABQ5DE27_9ASTR